MGMIIGIDPGLSAIGLAAWGPLETATVRIGGQADPDERLERAVTGVAAFVTPRNPDVVVIEAYAAYGLKGSITNAFQMGRLIQAILDCLAYELPWAGVEMISAREARRFVAGNPNAKPSQIREGLRLLGYSQRMNDHERDALALVLYWLDGKNDNS